MQDIYELAALIANDKPRIPMDYTTRDGSRWTYNARRNTMVRDDKYELSAELIGRIMSPKVGLKKSADPFQKAHVQARIDGLKKNKKIRGNRKGGKLANV